MRCWVCDPRLCHHGRNKLMRPVGIPLRLSREEAAEVVLPTWTKPVPATSLEFVRRKLVKSSR